MAIFGVDAKLGYWMPSQLAAGPFAGLQGGAVAGLLTGEIEALASVRGWGMAVSAAAWFLRAVPMARLRTQIATLREGGRVAVVDNSLWVDGDPEPCATVRVTLIRHRAVEVPGFVPVATLPADPRAYPLRQKAAPHGRPWFLDAMEARLGEDVAWYRQRELVVDGAGPLSRVLGRRTGRTESSAPWRALSPIRTLISPSIWSGSLAATGSVCGRRPSGNRVPASEWVPASFWMWTARSEACLWPWL